MLAVPPVWMAQLRDRSTGTTCSACAVYWSYWVVWAGLAAYVVWLVWDPDRINRPFSAFWNKLLAPKTALSGLPSSHARAARHR